MAEKVLNYDLAAEIVAEIEKRVGSVGEQSVALSEPGERYGSIALSRGGLVTPEHSYNKNYEARRRDHRYTGGLQKGELMYPDAPEPTQTAFDPLLAIIKQDIGLDNTEGLHRDNGVALSEKDSHEYVFVRGNEGLWRAYDAVHQSADNYWTQTTEYFLDASRLVTTDEEGFAIQGLIVAFDAALEKRAAAAVREETGLYPPGY